MPDLALIVSGVVEAVARDATSDPDPFGDAAGERVAFDDGLAVPGMLWDGSALSPPPVLFPAAQAAKAGAVRTEYGSRVNAGVPVAGLHVQIDDGARANLSGMAVTALAAIGGAVPWPASYATGWVAKEGVRIPLPAPADGIGLAATCGNFYAELVQNEQNLLDAVDAATDQAGLDAIDITAGWP